MNKVVIEFTKCDACPCFDYNAGICQHQDIKPFSYGRKHHDDPYLIPDFCPLLKNKINNGDELYY